METANELYSPPSARQRLEPSGIDERSSHAALRAIATVEIVKGAAVLLIGFGLLTLLHKDVQIEAESLLIHLHINPDRRLSQAFLDAAANVTSARLWAYSAACAIYAAVRFTEGYGLWHSRVWAEWFALLSGAMYLPWEVLKVMEHPSPIHWSLLLINLVVVGYMAYVRIAAWRPPRYHQG
ncbi:MAG TPA: DUF2127 domain-containing protein [Bryobacteraceae bacterium]|nr:DUF2127 domain-containing protein [Bryobacteraceae bacterium]